MDWLRKWVLGILWGRDAIVVAGVRDAIIIDGVIRSSISRVTLEQRSPDIWVAKLDLIGGRDMVDATMMLAEVIS